MNKIFNINPPAKVRRSAFDLSHERKLTGEIGKIIPVLMEEVVPGDKWKVQTTQLIRLAPMLAPLYHRLNAYVHYFFVPNRLLWDGWEDFITNQPGAGSVPQCNVPANPGIGSLPDHMGLPMVTGSTSGLDVNVLPFLAYHLIWNEYYRNQHLQAELDIKNPANYNALANMPLHYRNWEKDYFTSALPFAQQNTPVYAETSPVAGNAWIRDPVTNQIVASGGNLGTDATGKLIQNPSGNAMNLDVSSGVLIEDLRQANRLQRWLERNVRSGSRYVEHLLAHFGISAQDSRLQRPEYLGGGKSPIVVSEVLNNTSIDPAFGGQLPQGYPTGHGISVGQTNQAELYAHEHGYIVGLMSVMPDSAYMQGIPRKFKRTTALDFYWPEFAQLGEQEVMNSELWVNPTTPLADEGVFGYQSRYAEYKYIPSTSHGEFRSTLDFWHLTRKFAVKPVLNEEFVQCKPRSEDIFAVTYDKEHLWINLSHNIVAIRPMPFFNVPSLE